ncbi:putative hexose carrier protein [Neofusicoccum parvum]|uniref:Major facilitator superfamily (MFS) profile domain-containing protein n=3 Tax=Neofusicoccum TaxID=407951 RepID=A0ABR3TFY4_9PEZI|nr:putative hexose carrier protein [Neofusicoccum parvum UCRNP2]GME33143.1 putative hexose carrier protein [Neofusicoccum parvum]GME39490.1 putative hexose carrier protein [Neofusicoccum parvum]
MVLQGRTLYRTAVTAGSLGFITFGWDAGVLGGVLLTPDFQEAIGYPNTTIISMVTSVFLLASWLGCVIISTFGMRMGRRSWIIAGEVVQIIGTIISATSYSYGQLIAGRVLIGVGNGFCTSMIPVYVAEMAISVKVRGASVNFMICSAAAGIALAYWVDFGMTFATGQVVWRFPVALQIMWSLLTLAFIWPTPDTPRYYYAKGRNEQGDNTLERLYGKALDDHEVSQSRKDILASIELEKVATASLRLKDFFWDTSDLQAARRIRTGVILVGIGYLIGTDMVYYYMTTIFQTYIGLPAVTSSALAAVATTVLTITNFMGVTFMEKLGRRTWLIAGAVGQTIFMATFTGLMSSPGAKTGAAAAAMLFGWIAVFGPTWGPVPYVYSSEIMPLRYRHIGFSLSVSAQWLSAFLTTFAGPIAIADTSVGWKTWIWFLVFNVIAGPYVYFCCPETRGRTLEEVDLIFMSERLENTAAAKQLHHTASISSTSTENAAERGSVSPVKEG